MKYMNATVKSIPFVNPKTIVIKEKDEKTGKERLRELHDLKLTENEDGTITISGSYIPTYEEIYEANYEMAKIINQAIEYIDNHQLVFKLSTMEQIKSWYDKLYKTLLDILKGSDSNDK